MWIPVFKTGTWTDSQGNTKTWTEQDLDQIVEKNNAVLGDQHDSPCVIGHPKDNSPAYGWTEKLKREGDILYAKIKPTVNEFVDWLKNKVYNKVSISLYADGLLRHIGFLGGMPPAVKGLKMPEFNEEKEFSEIEVSPNMSFPAQAFTKTEDKTSKSNHSEGDMPDKNQEKLQQLEEKISQLENENQKLKTDFQEVSTEKENAIQELGKIRMNMRKMEFEQFLNEEIAFGALNEDQQSKAKMILENLSTINFSEDGPDLVSEFKEFLKSLPAKVPEGEIARKGYAPDTDTDIEKQREKKIEEYMEKNDGVSYRDAALYVSKKHPELFGKEQSN